MGLQEIHLSLKIIRNNEINKIHTFANEKEKLYNEPEKERSDSNENDLYNSKWGEDPSIKGEREIISNREIFRNEARLLDESQEKSLSRNVNERYVNEPLRENRYAGSNETRSDNETINQEREHNRRIESQRPNEMGSLNERSEKSSRGNYQERNNLQLEIYDIKDDENRSFYILLDSEINEILINTPHLKKSKAEIYDFFISEKDINKRIEYLKSVFNPDYSGVLVYEKMYWYKTYDNGVLFVKGNTFLKPEAKIFVSWKDLIDNYDSMILLRQLNGSLSLNNNNQFSLFNDNNVNFEFTQDFINKYLQSIKVETRFDIYNFFQKNLSNKAKADYLKEFYGIGGASFTVNGSGVSEMHDSKGIKFYYGYFEEKYYQEKLFTWDQIAKSIQDLINRDEYFTLAEKNIYPSLKDTTPEALYSYNVGDKVIIEDKKYEITKIGLFDIELYNPENTLISRTMNRVIFNYELEKNSYNDYLKTNINSEKYYGEYNDEVDIIKYVLHQYKLDDINVAFDSNENIVMYDNDGNSWEGKEVYDLLFYDLFDYNDKGTVDLIDDEAFNRLVDYKKVYEIKTLEKEKLENELLDKHISIDNKEYVIDSIDNNLVTLIDPTKDEKEGSYKTNIKPLEEIQNIISNNEENKEVKEQLSLLDEIKELNNVSNSTVINNIDIDSKIKKSKITKYVLHPEVPLEDRLNYKIINDSLGVGSAKEKYRNNIEAIKILKKCESENRYATAEEQEILVKYVGWGGLSQAFDENNIEWSSEYNELKNLLNEEEYEQAMETTTTAFYTPPKIIKAIYKALEQMGLEKGNILEPSCGTGNFIGLMPNNDNLKIYGVEVDSISGGIAKQLYQKASIEITGFEKVDYPDSFFDVAIGNVPFANYSLKDKRYNKYNFLIHDYFFAKTLDKVRPGGVIAFITSNGTMDKENKEVRKYIAQRADLLGAIRLPNNAFKDNAGTTVTTDIIFLQKRDTITDIEPDWLDLDTDYKGIKMNKYFVDHPKMILGNMEVISSQYGPKNACIPYEDKDISELLNEAVKNIHAEITDYEIEEVEEDNSIEADITVENFSFTVIDDKVYYRENSRMYPQNLSLTAENRVKGLVELRDCTRKLMNLQLEDYSEEKIKEQQITLNNLYDKFTKKYGLINSKANDIAFNNDNSY